MAIPLHSFMKDLLSDTSISVDHSTVSLVVDNAKCRSPRSSLGADSDHSLFQRRGSATIMGCKEQLDVSDHSRRESRWETSSFHECSNLHTPVTPTRPEPGTCGSPMFTPVKCVGSPITSKPRKGATDQASNDQERRINRHNIPTEELVQHALDICNTTPL